MGGSSTDQGDIEMAEDYLEDDEAGDGFDRIMEEDMEADEADDDDEDEEEEDGDDPENNARNAINRQSSDEDIEQGRNSSGASTQDEYYMLYKLK